MSHYSSRPIYNIPPPGWAPPFQGAPPIPTNMMINPQQWQMGSWSFNPAYNMQRYPVATAWQPAPAWVAPHVQQPPQQQPNYNPYKKPVKPPSAEYLAMKLPDNGLDLHNMVPAKDPYGDEEANAAPQTPWIWNPATLSNDAASSSSTSSGSTSTGSNSTDSTPSSRRHASEPPMSDVERTPRPRHATQPSANETTPNGSSSNQSARPTNTPERAPESFTSKRELKPTFSLNIIRTPNHYKDSNRSPTSGTSGSPQQSQGSASPMDSLTGRMNRVNTSDVPPSNGHAPLFRNASMPPAYATNQPSSVTGAPALVDEPSSILSPLVLATPHLPPPRTIGRVSTYPDISNSSLNTIAENPTPPPPPEDPPRRRRSRHATSPDPFVTPQPVDYAEVTPRAAPLNYPHHTPPESTYPSRESPRKSSRSSGHQSTPPDPYSAHGSTSSESRESSRKSSRSSGHQYTPPDAYPAYRQPSPESREPSRKSSRSSGSQQPLEPSPDSREPSRKSSRSSGHQHTPSDPYSARRSSTPESASRRGIYSPPEPAPEQPYDPYRPKQPFIPAPPGPYANPARREPSPRHRTKPSPPDAPPEEPSRLGHYSSPNTPYDPYRPKQPFIPSSRETSFTPNPVRPPPPKEPSPSPQRSSFQSTTPRDPLFPSSTNTSSGSSSLAPYPYPDNPLPPPPKPIHIKYFRMAPPPIPEYTSWKTLRVGFWNRRGDHMTPEGYVVYAPEDMAYPKELEDYPSEDVGYQNDFGTIISYDPERPELLESLPLHGKPPKRPYKDFIKYENREVLKSTIESSNRR